jgi:hypothetical protein
VIAATRPSCRPPTPTPASADDEQCAHGPTCAGVPTVQVDGISFNQGHREPGGSAAIPSRKASGGRHPGSAAPSPERRRRAITLCASRTALPARGRWTANGTDEPRRSCPATPSTRCSSAEHELSPDCVRRQGRLLTAQGAWCLHGYPSSGGTAERGRPCKPVPVGALSGTGSQGLHVAPCLRSSRGRAAEPAPAMTRSARRGPPPRWGDGASGHTVVTALAPGTTGPPDVVRRHPCGVNPPSLLSTAPGALPSHPQGGICSGRPACQNTDAFHGGCSSWKASLVSGTPRRWLLNDGGSSTPPDPRHESREGPTPVPDRPENHAGAWRPVRRRRDEPPLGVGRPAHARRTVRARSQYVGGLCCGQRGAFPERGRRVPPVRAR